MSSPGDGTFQLLGGDMRSRPLLGNRNIAASTLVVIGLLPTCASAIDGNADVSVTQVLKTSRTWAGAPITYPPGNAEITCLIIEIAPGGETGWHEHPVPSFALVLEGAIEVRLANGAKKRATAGEALAEVIDTQHSGRNIGSVPLKLAVFYTGAVGVGLSRPIAR